MREKGQTEVAKTLETPVFSRGIGILTERIELLTGKEDAVYEDNGYLGADKREDAIARNKAGRRIKYKINRRPSQTKKLSKSGQYAAKKVERAKFSVRAKVEHVFGGVKKQLRFRKTRYRGFEKQQAKLYRVCVSKSDPG